jgi:hypothetical protein
VLLLIPLSVSCQVFVLNLGWKNLLGFGVSLVLFSLTLVHYETPYFSFTFCKAGVDICLLNKLYNYFSNFLYITVISINFSSVFPSMFVRICHGICKFQMLIREISIEPTDGKIRE